MTTPRVVFIDIETAPAVGFFWGHTHETDIIKVLKPGFVLSFAYRWMGEKKIHFVGLPDVTPHYQHNLENDCFLLGKLRDVLDEADVVIAHNGDRFDLPTIQGRFIRYRMAPPSPFKTIDTLKTCQHQFKLPSNRLNFVAEYLDIGKKLPHTGLDLWERCMQGDTAGAWPIMKRYNIHDVYLLEEVYKIIRPFIKNHPDLTVYDYAENHCPTCRSTHVIKSKPIVSAKRQYEGYHCRDCGTWFKGKVIKRA